MKLLLEFLDNEPYLEVTLTKKDFDQLVESFYVTDECYLEDKKINLGLFITEDEEYALKKRHIKKDNIKKHKD